MVLKDLGHIDFEEPYKTFRAHGLIIADGAKVEEQGQRDRTRSDHRGVWCGLFTYLMFLGPFEEGGDYRPQGIQGPFGFLHRLWGHGDFSTSR